MLLSPLFGSARAHAGTQVHSASCRQPATASTPPARQPTPPTRPACATTPARHAAVPTASSSQPTLCAGGQQSHVNVCGRWANGAHTHTRTHAHTHTHTLVATMPQPVGMRDGACVKHSHDVAVTAVWLGPRTRRNTSAFCELPATCDGVNATCPATNPTDPACLCDDPGEACCGPNGIIQPANIVCRWAAVARECVRKMGKRCTHTHTLVATMPQPVGMRDGACVKHSHDVAVTAVWLGPRTRRNTSTFCELPATCDGNNATCPATNPTDPACLCDDPGTQCCAPSGIIQPPNTVCRCAHHSARHARRARCAMLAVSPTRHVHALHSPGSIASAPFSRVPLALQRPRHLPRTVPDLLW
jgi:hypothetical protein